MQLRRKSCWLSIAVISLRRRCILSSSVSPCPPFPLSCIHRFWFVRVLSVKWVALAKISYHFSQIFRFSFLPSQSCFLHFIESLFRPSSDSLKSFCFLRKVWFWVKFGQDGFDVFFRVSRSAFRECAQQCVHPTGGSLCVFEQFAWLEVGSVKMAFSRPIHQRVTQTVRLR